MRKALKFITSISGTKSDPLLTNFVARYLLDKGANVNFGIMELGHQVTALEAAIDNRMFQLASELVTKRGMDPFSMEGRVCAIEKLVATSEYSLKSIVASWEQQVQLLLFNKSCFLARVDL